MKDLTPKQAADKAAVLILKHDFCGWAPDKEVISAHILQVLGPLLEKEEKPYVAKKWFRTK